MIKSFTLWPMQGDLPFHKYSSSFLVTRGLVLSLSHLHSILRSVVSIVMVFITFEQINRVMERDISVRIWHRDSLTHDTFITRRSWHVTCHTLSTCCHTSLSSYFKKLPSKQTFVQWKHLFAFDLTKVNRMCIPNEFISLIRISTIFGMIWINTKCGLFAQDVEDMRSGWWCECSFNVIIEG